MKHPPETDRPLPGHLDSLGVLRFAGPDAVAFLQGQVSNDTTPLTAGEPVLAAYSSPQGRVLAVLSLLPHSSGVLAVLPRELAQPTLERLRKYVLRAKVRLEDVSGEFAVLGLCDGGVAPALTPPDPGRGYVERDLVGIARVGGAANRLWVVGASRSIADIAATTDAALAEDEWRLANIRDGLPEVYAATRELFVAQMLNLDLVGGISFTKGCFTGQEIIARTQHLGRIKRRMFRLRLPDGAWTVGQAVRLGDGRVGRLTEVAPAEAHVEALAVLTLEGAAPGAATDADEGVTPRAELVEGTVLPLPYGLAAGSL